MEFRTAVEHYKVGTASVEERRLVESELEKQELLLSLMPDLREQEPPASREIDIQLQRIRKNIRKRNWALVITSLILAAAVLLGAVRFAVPALESMYWDPRTVSFDTAEGTDLDMTLAAYDDLFSPTTNFQGARINHTGFASYAVTIQALTGANNESVECYASLNSGSLFIPDGLWDFAYHNQVGSYWMSVPESLAVNRRFVVERLSQLPEFVQVGAYITFAEDKTLSQTFAFRDEICNGNVDRINQTGYCWTAIRHSADMDNTVRCGISSESYTRHFPEANGVYPAFSEYHAYEDLQVSGFIYSWAEQTYSQHFKSLLRYLDDQLQQGTGIPAPPSGTGEMDPEYYTKALAYVEENGVMAYGCYIFASPQALLEILEREDVLMVYPTEGWLNI